MDAVNPFRRVRIGLVALVLVLLGGTVGYLLFGFDLIDALYQTVITVTTVGFNSPHPLNAGSKGFTIALILLGVGTALYTFSTVLEVLIEGHMRELVRRRRMDRDIARMDNHVIVCGLGRVGREVARFLNSTGRDVVVIDRDPTRLEHGAVSINTWGCDRRRGTPPGRYRPRGHLGRCSRHRCRQPLCNPGREVDTTRSADHRQSA